MFPSNRKQSAANQLSSFYMMGTLVVKKLNKHLGCLFKLPDLDPVFKMNNPLEKENYRPVSVLLVVSNIFETII